MGVIKWFSSDSSPMLSQESIESDAPKNIYLPNPDPENYSIGRWIELGGYTVVEIKYHDCVNYGGRKILVFECSIKDLIRQKKIDPHFIENEEYFFPIARFVPTEEGWNHANRYVDSLIAHKKLRTNSEESKELLKNCVQPKGVDKNLRITRDQINRLSKVAQNIADNHWHDDDVSGGYIDDENAKQNVQDIYAILDEIDPGNDDFPGFEDDLDGHVNGNG